MRFVIRTKMGSALTTRCVALNGLVNDGASVDHISQHLDQDPKLCQYLSETRVFDAKEFPVWSVNQPPLHLAASLGKDEVVKLFHTKKYNFFPDAQLITGDSSVTPLHQAILGNHTKCVRLLLEHGANPHLGGSVGSQTFGSALEWSEMREGTKEGIKGILQKVVNGKQW